MVVKDGLLAIPNIVSFVTVFTSLDAHDPGLAHQAMLLRHRPGP